MKEQLTLEHLALYLPYKLKVRWEYEIGTEFEDTAIWILHPTKDALDSLRDNEHISLYNLLTEVETVYKPILRPLSDLTKEIEVNSEKFVPIDVIKDEFLECDTLIYGDAGYGWIGLYNDNTLIPFYMECDMEIMPEIHYGIVTFLAKWHFDIFGLISKGLAIDINTL